MSERLCTFRVGPLLLGIDVLHVQEVVRAPDLTDVPLAGASVAGLLNLRGRILTVMDTRRWLGMTDLAEGAPAMRTVVIVTGEGETSGVLVDAEGEVIELEAEEFEQVPEAIAPEMAALLCGVYKVDGDLLLVLDPARLLAGTAS